MASILRKAERRLIRQKRTKTRVTKGQHFGRIIYSSIMEGFARRDHHAIPATWEVEYHATKGWRERRLA